MLYQRGKHFLHVYCMNVVDILKNRQDPLTRVDIMVDFPFIRSSFQLDSLFLNQCLSSHLDSLQINPSSQNSIFQIICVRLCTYTKRVKMYIEKIYQIFVMCTGNQVILVLTDVKYLLTPNICTAHYFLPNSHNTTIKTCHLDSLNVSLSFITINPGEIGNRCICMRKGVIFSTESDMHPGTRIHVILHFNSIVSNFNCHASNL